MKIAETERLLIREMDSEQDAEFIFSLLNSPKFIRYIGDRGVRSAEQARDFIENRYRQSYVDNGFGLYTVEQSEERLQVGICGFVKRASLDHPDIGFAFLPDYEGRGYGYESAECLMRYGRKELGFTRVLAITTRDNDASGKLLLKLGFAFEGPLEMPDGDILNLYSAE